MPLDKMVLMLMGPVVDFSTVAGGPFSSTELYTREVRMEMEPVIVVTCSLHMGRHAVPRSTPSFMAPRKKVRRVGGVASVRAHAPL